MLFFFPRDVLNEILNLIESVSEGFPTYSHTSVCVFRSVLNKWYCHNTGYNPTALNRVLAILSAIGVKYMCCSKTNCLHIRLDIVTGLHDEQVHKY